MSPYFAGFVGTWLICTGLVCGCVNVRDDAVRVLNASSDTGATFEATLESLDRHEQEDAVNHAWTQAAAQEAAAAVRAKYAGAWKAYRDYRAAMVLALAAVSAYDASVAAGKTPDAATLTKAAEDVQAAETALLEAMQTIRESRPTADGGA